MVDTPAQAGFIFELLGSEGGKAELFGATNVFLADVARVLEAELSGGRSGATGLELQLNECTADFFEETGGGEDAMEFTYKVIDLYTLLNKGETTPASVTELVNKARGDFVDGRFPGDQND